MTFITYLFSDEKMKSADEQEKQTEKESEADKEKEDKQQLVFPFNIKSE